MAGIEVFLWGTGGSVAVEAVTALGYYHRGQFPSRYRKPGFWIVRAIVATAGGFLAVAYSVDTAILAGNIGASAPLILKALSEGLKPD